MPSLQNILLGNKYLGIEQYTQDGSEYCAYVSLGQRNGELEIEKKTVLLSDEKLPAKWDRGLPAFLVLNTSHVLQKEVIAIDAADEKIIHKAFPNIQAEEFYYEVWRLKTKSLVIISRKSHVDAVVTHYNTSGFTLTGISLGIGPVSELTEYSATSHFNTNTHIVSTDETGPIISVKTDSLISELSINGLIIENTFINAFAGVLRLISHRFSTTGNVPLLNNFILDAVKQQRFFTKALKATLFFLLSVLLVNFFAFSHYYAKVQEASAEAQQNEAIVTNIKKLRDRVKLKEQRLVNFTELSSARSTVLINEIARTIPASILLSNMVSNPLQKKIKEGEPLEIENKTIYITGTTSNELDFTGWIKSVERLSFVNKVVIMSFGKSDRNLTGFSIKLIVNR